MAAPSSSSSAQPWPYSSIVDACPDCHSASHHGAPCTLKSDPKQTPISRLSYPASPLAPPLAPPSVGFRVRLVVLRTGHMPAVLRHPDRLRRAFDLFFAWRRELKKTLNSTQMKMVDLKCLTPADQIPLFPRRPDSEADSLLGRDRSLALQRVIPYQAHSAGVDTIGPWSVDPLGMLCEAFLLPRHTEGHLAWSFDDTYEALMIQDVVVHVVPPEDPVFQHRQRLYPRLTEQDKLMELHKIEAFVSWFEHRHQPQSHCWKPFPEVVHLETLTNLQKELVRKMHGKEPHRGFLLYGPAGTGKSWSVTNLVGTFRMNCVWGYSDDGLNPIVGTGAALKGGLQGDLEMRIFALFMRAQAAPWLPTAITIDEIDFTAPTRKSFASQDSGGNLWLERLSDGVRAENVTFLATTNLRTNVLEQLVDRLDNVYVGLLNSRDLSDIITQQSDEWGPGGHFKHLQEKLLLPQNHRRDPSSSIPYYCAVLQGMTPRAIKTLRTDADIREVQLSSNPWPTLTQGPRTFQQLIEEGRRGLPFDLGALFRFLIWAHDTGVLSGRILVDTTRLRERFLIVEVEIVNNLQPGELLFLDANQWGHTLPSSRRGKGRTLTRTFILHEQNDELGLWSVFARFSLYIRATHCSYVSDEFLKSMAGESQQSADERNRASISTTILQYVINVENAVLLLPLRYARIQKPEDSNGSLPGSSNINANEVWDMITGGWRCHHGKKQVFVLVASEEWEVKAVLASCTMAWQISEYRQHLLDRDAEEHLCSVCDRKFSTKTWKEGYGCRHQTLTGDKTWRDSMIIHYDPPPANSRSMVASVAFEQILNPDPDAAIRAKWRCCGKPFLELECTVHRHTPILPYEEAVQSLTTGDRAHRDVRNRWWCNYCCNVANAPGCTPVGLLT